MTYPIWTQGYPPASSMPKGPHDKKGGVPNYYELTAAQKVEAERKFYAEESEKLYAAKDSHGAVFLIKNPVCWERRINADGTNTMVRPKPIPLDAAPKSEGKKQKGDEFKW